MTPRSRRAPRLGLILDAGQPEPLHRQIGTQLRRAILEKRLAPGVKLPSSRLMASELQCARGTVLLAVDQLVAEGYLVTQAGAGLFVAANLPDEMLVSPPLAADMPHPAAPTIAPRRAAPVAFAFAPDRHAFPFPLWAKLLEREWRDPDWQIAGASYSFGHPGLRAAIAAYLGEARGFRCAPDDVVITSGVRQGLALFARVVLKPRDQAWVEEPCYPGMREALAAAGMQVVSVPIDMSGFATEAALRLAPQARLAIVTPSHQYPLGTVLSLQRRLALLHWAEFRQGWIVEDDFDGEYRYSGRPLAPLRSLDRTGRVAYLGSFSKLMFPALRLSYLVLPAALVAPALRLMDRVTERASLIGQGPLARFIADGHFAAHLRRTRLLYAARQEALIAAAVRHLAGVLELAADPGGMHLIARPPPGFDDLAATEAAAAADISVAPLSVCYAGPAKVHGLMLGYSGTPAGDIDVAARTLRQALDAGEKRSK